MARTICIANQKGGVGKTTTSVNLAAALADLGRQVLIVDMDPQGNASSGLGIKRYENQENNIYQVLIGEKPIRETIQTTQVQGLNIIPANPDLVGAEIELVDMPQREYRLKSALNEFQDKYHYIFIDCPPSLGLLTVNSLSAAETFLVPLQCEYYALEGLSQLLNTAGLIKKSLNPALRIEGICLTMFDARNNLSHQVVAEIQSHFGDKVFQAIIPRNVRLSEAPSHCQTIFQYDPKSLGAKKYKELAVELDARVYGPRPDAAATAFATATASETVSETETENQTETETFADADAETAAVAGISTPHLEIVPDIEDPSIHSHEVDVNV
jgi:chromosome partitioning protein